MVIAGGVRGFIIGSIAGAALGFIYSLIWSRGGQAAWDMLLGVALFSLLNGLGVGALMGTIGGMLLGFIFGFARNVWIAPTLAVAGGTLAAYTLYGAPAFHLAPYGWTIFPLAAIFAGVSGWVLGLRLIPL